MPFNLELGAQRRQETIQGLKSAWQTMKEMSAKQLALGALQAGTFPFSALGKTDWGNEGLLEQTETAPMQAISPWMAMKKQANAAKQELLQKRPEIQDLMRSWQSGANHHARTRLGEILQQAPEELRRTKLAKLVAKTETRRNPETNTLEYLLYRGIGPEEFEKMKENGLRTNAYASFTPDPKVAKQFASPHLVKTWVPEDHIAGIPKELGAYSRPKGAGKNSFRDELEVITKPGLDIDNGGTLYLDGALPENNAPLKAMLDDAFNKKMEKDLAKKLLDNELLPHQRQLLDQYVAKKSPNTNLYDLNSNWILHHLSQAEDEMVKTHNSDWYGNHSSYDEAVEAAYKKAFNLGDE